MPPSSPSRSTRRQRYPQEKAFRYQPFAGREDAFRLNDETFDKVIRDYNLADLASDFAGESFLQTTEGTFGRSQLASFLPFDLSFDPADPCGLSLCSPQPVVFAPSVAIRT